MITEIMYHPLDANPDEIAAGYSNSDFEYIEMKNISESLTLDLTELRFTKGVDFNFSEGAITSLTPGAYLLIVRNQAAFESRYSAGLPIAGEWQSGDKIDNGGEKIKLSYGAGSTIHEFTYDDSLDWPTSPDGEGPSLVLIAPESAPDHANPLNWRPSTTIGGTPGASDATKFSGNPNADRDNDGSTALLEYFLGTSDADPASTGLPVISTWRFDDETGTLRSYPTFSFQMNLAADDIIFEVQYSPDLETGKWVPAEAMTLVSLNDNGDGTAQITLRSATPLDSSEREFFRLLVKPRL
jgi:hypothetical protein